MKKKQDNTALVNMLVYSFLLIGTPFLLVRNYLQQAIGMFSQWSYQIAGMKIPYVLSAAILFLVVMLILNFKNFKLIHLLAFGITAVLMGIGQSSTDYYFNHDFYELQHNWHYFAYGIFAWVSYLYHQSKGSSRIRYIWNTMLYGALISIFDETAQIFISGRVFDICDNGKDIWGMVVGLIVVLLFSKSRDEKIRILHHNVLANLKHTWSAIFILVLFSYIFLSIASILSEKRYLVEVMIWTVGVFLPLISVIYLCQFKVPRIVIVVLLGMLLIAGIITINNNKTNIIIQKEAGVLSWRGINIPWFDLMIKSNGMPRLVDKKIYFNKKDKINRIYELSEDILIMGSGTRGQGGMGFTTGNSNFVFNPITRRPLQILIYPNIQACRIYNQLISEGKKAMIIIHNG